MDRITLSSMRYECLIGAGEEERSFPQMLEIDLVVEADLSAAAGSDALADTIDYGPLVTLTERPPRGAASVPSRAWPVPWCETCSRLPRRPPP